MSVSDPDDYYEPKGDIHQIGVGDGGDGSLVFSTQVAEYSDPFTDPSWANQDTAAEWLLDTSGGGLSGVIVGVYIVGTELRARVFDIYTRGLVCRGVPTADAASRTYSAKVGPGCLGEVKTMSMTAVFHYENHRRVYDRDTAPNDGAVRFGLPAAGPATAGYAVVSRSAGFQRFGAVPRARRPRQAPSTTTAARRRWSRWPALVASTPACGR